MLRIPHYQLFRLERQTCDINNPNRPKAGGGLCIYVQDEITVDTISLAHLNTSDGNMELQCIKLTPRNQKQYTIFNLYRPPNGNVSEFLSNLDDKLTDYIGLENNEIFLMGDFNLNYLDVNSINVNSLKSNMEVLGLSQVIDQPTRYSALNPPTLIQTHIKIIHVVIYKIVRSGAKCIASLYCYKLLATCKNHAVVV